MRSWEPCPHATSDQRLGVPIIWVWICVCEKSFFVVFVVGGLVLFECNTSINTSHKSRVSCPSIRS